MIVMRAPTRGVNPWRSWAPARPPITTIAATVFPATEGTAYGWVNIMVKPIVIAVMIKTVVIRAPTKAGVSPSAVLRVLKGVLSEAKDSPEVGGCFLLTPLLYAAIPNNIPATVSSIIRCG
jgi:hypothetical protein